MIVKFFKNKGAGSATASVNYLLGKDRDRQGARVLHGNAELTAQLAESLEFKHKYTVGCLSFAEQDKLDENAKREIMASFERTLMAGLNQDRYNILWVEHTDKDRLELNFLIPKVDLGTGKAMNPYFDKTDRGLVDVWKQVINYDYGLHDPDDPKNRQTLVTVKDLPKSKQEFKQALTAVLEQKILADEIKDHADIIKELENMGLEIARTTPTAISIKDPDGGRNIRLKGEIYEQTFTANQATERESQRASESYRNELEQRISRVRDELTSRIEAKSAFNATRYKTIPSREQSPNEQAHGIQDPSRGSNGDFVINPDSIRGVQSVLGQENSHTARAIRRHTTGDRQQPPTSQSTNESTGNGTGRQDLHRQQDEQSQNMAKQRQATNYGATLNVKAIPERVRAIATRARTLLVIARDGKSDAQATDRAITATNSGIRDRKQQANDRKQRTVEIIGVAKNAGAGIDQHHAEQVRLQQQQARQARQQTKDEPKKLGLDR